MPSNYSPQRAHNPRAVYLPPENLENCDNCEGKRENTTKKIFLCGNCGERIYCSKECQSQDWPEHKSHCGKTDRITLEKFHPLIALLVDATRTITRSQFEDSQQHFAMTSPIVSDYGSRLDHTTLPDGTKGKLLVVDDTRLWFDPISALASAAPLNMLAWFPGAPSAKVAEKLVRRIGREGHLLPSLTAICIALLGELYTATSSAGSPQVRKRLQYRTSPISDFGIAKGSVLVPECDRLLYQKLSDGSYVTGQDPDEHYWLYFTTIRGEEVILDLGMYTFNMCIMIAIAPYQVPGISELLGNTVPGYFVHRELRKTGSLAKLHTERKRIAALRHPALQRAVVHLDHAIGDDEVKDIVAFMQEIAERPVVDPSLEVELACTAAMHNCVHLEKILNSREWESYPDSPTIGFDLDPGQEVNWDDIPEVPRSGFARRRFAS